MAENESPWDGQMQDMSSQKIVKGQSERKKRLKWIPLIVVLAVVIGSSISILSVEYGMRWIGVYSNRADFFSDSGSGEEELSIPATSLPSIYPGDNVTLSISMASDEELTLQEIYQKAIRSVVSVVGNVSTGTGIIFHSDGYILTNAHVVSGNTEIEVRLQDGSRYEAFLIGKDEKSDLAVLKIEATGLQAAEFGDSDTLQVGDLVVAIGDPLGVTLHGTMTDGIISAINRDVTVDGKVMTLIQTNAALNTGNSGGPLLNSAGQVIGINNMKIVSLYSTVEGLGFAIPVSTAKPLVDEILQTGSVRYAVIGIQVQSVAEEKAGEIDEGLLVVKVESGSDAYEKGVRAGDKILAVNGQRVNTIEELESAKKGLEIGDTMEFTILSSDGEERVLSIALVDEATLLEG